MSHQFNPKKIETVITDGNEDIPEEREEESRPPRPSRRSKRSNLVIIVAVAVAAVVLALIIIYLISRRKNKRDPALKDAPETETENTSPKSDRSYTDEQVEKFSQRARQRISEYKSELDKKNNQIDELQKQLESLKSNTSTKISTSEPEDVAEGITIRRSKKPEKKPSRPMNIPLKEDDAEHASDDNSESDTPPKPEVEEVAAILADEGHLETKSDD